MREVGPSVGNVTIMRSRLARLLLLTAPAWVGCQGPSPNDFRHRITGVTVQAVDRRIVNGTSQLVFADTLFGQVSFWITTHMNQEPSLTPELLAALSPAQPPVINPTVAAKSHLSVSRAIQHRGVSIPADTNLLSVEAIRNAIDSSQFDLFFPDLQAAIVMVQFRTDRFHFEPGLHTFVLRWETADGEVFADTVTAYLLIP
jgi:hypothetical protein